MKDDRPANAVTNVNDATSELETDGVYGLKMIVRLRNVLMFFQTSLNYFVESFAEIFPLIL